MYFLDRFAQSKTLLQSCDILTILLFITISRFLKRNIIQVTCIICVFEILKLWVYFYKINEFRQAIIFNYILNSVLIILFFLLSIAPIRSDRFELFINIIYLLVNILCLTKLVTLNHDHIKHIRTNRKSKSVINSILK